jgi:hypothetical protein
MQRNYIPTRTGKRRAADSGRVVMDAFVQAREDAKAQSALMMQQLIDRQTSRKGHRVIDANHKQQPKPQSKSGNRSGNIGVRGNR